MRVFVYFNLHRKCWSIKALSTEGNIKRGRVFAHASSVTLLNAVCKVSEAGRQRVLRERRKNIHAGIVGELFTYTGNDARTGEKHHGVELLDCGERVAITYNPYKAPTFVRRDTGAPVKGGSVAILGNRTCDLLEAA